MNEQAMILEALIPLVLFLITGLVIASYIYFRFRERQLMIEKGLTAEQIKELFDSKRKGNPYIWLKIGVVTIGVGLGVGFGVMAKNAGLNQGLIPLSIITLSGLGFVGAFFAARKFEKEDEKNRITEKLNNES